MHNNRHNRNGFETGWVLLQKADKPQPVDLLIMHHQNAQKYKEIETAGMPNRS
jgi:hypothetical protein